MFTEKQAAQLRARLLTAMSAEEARELLGFPPHANPSAADVRKMLRNKAKEHHPDKGGDPRKMVELSVAADILQGKREEDRTQVTRNPEEEKKREEERKRREAVNRVKAHADKAAKAMLTAIAPLTTGVRFPGKISLREYLNDTFVEAMDALQDAADEALKDKDLDSRDQRTWTTADRMSQGLTNQTARLASKYKTLCKASDQLKKKPTPGEAEKLLKFATDFRQRFLRFQKDASKLGNLLGTTEAVPFEVYDAQLDVYTILRAFADELNALKLDELMAMQIVYGSIHEAERVLKEFGVKTPKPKDWVIPDDFDKAMEKLSRSKTASSTMVVARFLRTI